MQCLVSVIGDRTGAGSPEGMAAIKAAVSTDGPFAAEGSKRCHRKIELRPVPSEWA